MKVELEVIEGAEKGRKFVFDAHDTFLVGRATEAHFRFSQKDPYISRHHFLLEVNPPECHLKDLDSTNGTKVNGEEVDACQVMDGDTIEIGCTTLRMTLKEFIYCTMCGREIAEGRQEGDVLCPECQTKQEEAGKAAAGSRCARCGRPMPPDEARGVEGAICYQCANKEANEILGKTPAEVKEEGRRPQAVEGAPTIPGYEIIRCLGKGGMGAVWLARDDKNQEQVAIKTVLPEVAGDERTIKRFLREMDECAALVHPHIVRFIDKGFASDQFYFVMEFVDGLDAQKLVEQRGGRVGAAEAVHIILQVLEALEYAHNRNIVHRDIKPPNVMLARSEEAWKRPEDALKYGALWNAKVNDLGLAKNFQLAGMSGMTLRGEFAGSPPFTAPEQIVNFRFVKPVSDVFSIGATLYHMLSGQFVYDIRRPKKWYLDILEGKPVPVRKRDETIDKDLAAVVDRAVSKEYEDRFQDAGQMRAVLMKYYMNRYGMLT